MNDSLPFHEPDRSADVSSRPTLDHLCLFAVRGADARSFLDSQLTRNVPQSLSPASIAGYCSPKGRLLATVVVWSDPLPDGETIYMLISRDIAENVVKRLRMYVLRAKVTIEDVTATHAIEGLLDPSSVAEDVLALDPWSVVRDGDTTWIRHPDAEGRKRLMRISAVSREASNVVDAPIDAATWRWSEIRAGIPRITATTQDRFVPQMVNLEALGGVDFKKGCFPGQEVVARSQYLGKLKRRTALAAIDDDDAVLPQPGSDVSTSETGDPVGLVVNAERGPDDRISLLLEIPLSLFDAPSLKVAQDRALKLESLPYALPDNEVFVRPKF